MSDDRMEDHGKSPHSLAWSVAIFVVMVLILGSLVIREYQHPNVETLVAVTVITLAMLVIPRIFDITHLSASHKGAVVDLQQRVREQSEAIKEQEGEIHQINRQLTSLLALSMPESMLLNLTKLASRNEDFKYVKESWSYA